MGRDIEVLSKKELLKRLHELLYRDDDLMQQETLFELQYLVDTQLVGMARQGKVKIKQYDNGYIHTIQ